ncbi:MAG: phosphate/phosphite/phosphonate ABC transporter substrate-binding protein [Gammaproteobacteria bacterium]
MSGPYQRRAGSIIAAILLFAVGPTNSEPAYSPPSPHIKNGFLTFGFLPVESPVALFKRFAPLRDYLSMQIQIKIRMETAKNFTEFVKRTRQRRYDLVFTAPHMALYALEQQNYEAAATFAKPLKSVIVVRKNSAIQNIAALEGKTIATPPESAIVTLVGKRYLQENALTAIRYRVTRTHNAAYSSVLGQETDAAIISNFIAKKAIANNLPLKIVGQSDPFPGIGILVAKDLPDSIKQHIKTSLWGMKDLPHGKKILREIAQPGYVKATRLQFEKLRPYVNSAIP